MAVPPPRWKDFPILKLEPTTEGGKIDKEAWQRWTSLNQDTMSIMNIGYFQEAAGNLQFENNKFESLVHPGTPDVLTSAAFKKAVVDLCVNAGYQHPTTAALNVNPSNAANYQANYTFITTQLKEFQVQFNNAVSKARPNEFKLETRENHPLKAMRIWKRIDWSFARQTSKDAGAIVKELQNMSQQVPSWDCERMTEWLESIESKREDLISVGRTEEQADDAIIENMIDALKEAPDEGYESEWKALATNWDIAREDNPLDWDTLRARMDRFIQKMIGKQRVRDSDPGGTSNSKRLRTETPSGMALNAQVPVRTRRNKNNKGVGSANKNKKANPAAAALKGTPTENTSTHSPGTANAAQNGDDDNGPCDVCGGDHGMRMCRGLRYGLRQLKVKAGLEPNATVLDKPHLPISQQFQPQRVGQAQTPMQRNPQQSGAAMAAQILGSTGAGNAFFAGESSETRSVPPPTLHNARPRLSSPGSEDGSPRHRRAAPVNPWAQYGISTRSVLLAVFILGLLSSNLFSRAAAVPLSRNYSEFSINSPAGMTLSQVLVFYTLLPDVDTQSDYVTPSAPLRAMQAVAANHSMCNSPLFVDSGCSFTIVNDPALFEALTQISPRRIDGFSGSRTLTMGGTITITVADESGNPVDIRIENALYDPQSRVNLISVKQLNREGYGVLLLPQENASGLVSRNSSDNLFFIPVQQQNECFFLPRFVDNAAPHTPCYAAYHHMTLEELMHWRTNHQASISRLIHWNNNKVRGLPRNLSSSRQVRVNCCVCDAANSTHADYPHASENIDDNGREVWHWDLLDMGEEWKTINGNRYATVIVNRRTRFLMVFLHESKTEIKQILLKARAKMGYWPAVMRSDGAPEYWTEEIAQLFLDNNVDHQCSNAQEQFQNAVAETSVNMLGRGIRALLLQSGLGPEFWGLCALHVAHVYNMLPHSSMDNQIPYTLQFGQPPDVSWLRPFGCEATVFRGADLVDHHKLAPRGEQGVCVGIGLMHGRKAWLVYSARTNRVYASTSVTFDETLFPARFADQRVYGYYDSHSVERFRADLHHTHLSSVQLPSVHDHPVWIPADASEADMTSSQAPTVPSSPSSRHLESSLEGKTSSSGGGVSLPPPVPPASADSGSAPGGGSRSGAGGGSRSGFGGGSDSTHLHAASSSGGGHFPNQRFDARGQRITFGDAAPAYGHTVSHWSDVAKNQVDSLSDIQLAEFLVGKHFHFPLPRSFWPRDKGQWSIICFDTVVADSNHAKDGFTVGDLLMKGMISAGPKRSKIGRFLYVPVSGQYSIRAAIKEHKPTALTAEDVVNSSVPVSKVQTASRAAAKAFAAFFPDSRPTRLQRNHALEPAHAFVAYTSLMQVAYMADAYGYDAMYLPPEPKHQKDARKRPDWEDWVKAEQIELDTVHGMGTIQYVNECSLLGKGISMIPTKFTYKCKFGPNGEVVRKKARLCVRGDMQDESEYDETYAPTSRFNSTRAIMAYAAAEDMRLMQFDVKGAFMVAPIDDQDIYIQLPEGYGAPKGKVAKLTRSLYGLKCAAYRYHKTFADWIEEYGFKSLDPDRTIFKYDGADGTLIMSIYVDDGLVAHNSEVEYNRFIKAISGKFELSTDDSEVSWYLGVSITRDYKRGTFHLSQKQYIKDLLSRFKMEDCKPALTPMEVGVRLTSDDVPATPDRATVREYQQVVGSLMYLVSWTRPECAYAVSQLARFMSNPGPSHVAAAKRVLRYLAGTQDLGITYHRDSGFKNQLYAFADADHAGDVEGRKSVSGYVVMLNGGAISWQSSRQAVVALSSAEAEYYAASAVGCDVVHLRRLLENMGCEQLGPTPVAEDNIACIYMSRTSVMYHRAKHIDVRVYKLREFVSEGVMTLFHVGTADQVADALTKSISTTAFKKHRDKMLGISFGKTSDQAAGGIEEDSASGEDFDSCDFPGPMPERG